MVGIEVVVYWDTLFIINFVYDFIGILLTKLITNIPTKFWRISLAAAICSLCQLLVLMDPKKLKNLGLYIGVNLILEIVILSIVFGRLKINKYISLIGVHMGIVFFVGGIITAIYDKLIAFKRQEITIIEIILIGIIVFLIIKYTVPIILRSIYYRERIYEIILFLKGKEIKIKALLDTGNSLTEPTTGKKVTVVEKKVISQFNNIHINKIFIIPYKSIGKDNGVLYGIEVDKMIIKYDKYEKVHDKAIIAIYNGDLSRDGRYKAILHNKSLI